jgi:hypothetical protein
VRNWQEVARIVSHIDPIREPTRAWKAFESHLSRAKWMTEHGYRHLLRGGHFRCEIDEWPSGFRYAHSAKLVSPHG